MAIHSYTAAKTLCGLRDWGISNLQINKILYIAHMIHLGRTNGQEALVRENFQAWDYGPVLPEVYRQTKAFGAKPVKNVFHRYRVLDEGDVFISIKDASDATKRLTPGQLVGVTHSEIGAWAKHYQPGVLGIIIPNEDIFDEYKKRTE